MLSEAITLKLEVAKDTVSDALDQVEELESDKTELENRIDDLKT